MKIYYFAWKNGNKADESSRQEWTELAAKEYKEIYESNKTYDISKRRFFERVSGVDCGNDVYYFECDYEQYKKYRAEKEKKARKEKQLKEDEVRYGVIQLLSLDAEYEDASGEDFTLYDIVADDNSLFEDRLVTDVSLESALKHLTEDERKIVDTLYLKNDDNRSERDFAEKMSIPQKTLNNRKLKILKKLKKYLAQN